MIGFINNFVTSPWFKLLFFIGLLALVVGIVIRYGLNSVVALSYGIYNELILLFIFMMSLFCSNVHSLNDLFTQYLSSLMPDFFSPLLDTFSVETAVEPKQYVYQAALIFGLNLTIEILSFFFSFLNTKTMFWSLSDVTTAVLAAFLYGVILKISWFSNVMLIDSIFVAIIFITIGLGLRAKKGTILGQIIETLLSCMISTIITFLFFWFFTKIKLLTAINNFNSRFLNARTPYEFLIIIGTILVIVLLWGTVLKCLRH